MTKSLQNVLQRQFNLIYYLNLSVSDQERMETFELDWMHQELISVKQKENNPDKEDTF